MAVQIFSTHCIYEQTRYAHNKPLLLSLLLIFFDSLTKNVLFKIKAKNANSWTTIRLRPKPFILIEYDAFTKQFFKIQI